MSDETTVEHRSEIVFLYDAVDANPNGNPLSGANRPRKDPVTDQAIVTDVRLKRYLRDQLEADGHGVYITSSRDDGYAKTREQMLKDSLGVTDPEDVGEDAFDGFLDNAVDARYFGATLSIDTDDDGIIAAVEDQLPDHLTGPVQFSPGKSLHPVVENEEYNSLTSVIGTQDEKQQGGFDLDDHRIKYALIGFHGLVDEHAAEDTNLTESDVRRLDTLCWRAVKNQTITRSKVGQEPRLYLRVEYADERFHVGGLTHYLDTAGDESDARAYRNVRDVTLDATDLLDRLADHAEHVERVHIVADGALDVVAGGEPIDLPAALSDRLGSDRVREVDVYDESEATRP
ncbi:type I-B CRISPR-associated protein Cas7/Csh2 [Halosimplex rubrum]|uniref:Type I-B CRISPR-associated protein Cas7/Csh2 n=1 Tax=Halosimplex rubrum TaxID=869889 RepID=A0A7D5P0E7_9EURY|nr:type I-B CRISPR-associated protein Cas7/Csh2 [Halosimplex rubrum]QLH77557.1 type I-B CRISPR-associated protein Cas7/Csh2 [Halosimplex rubrum]